MLYGMIIRIVCFITETLLAQQIDGASLYFKPLSSVNISSYPLGSQPPPQGPGEMALAPKKRFRRKGRLLGLTVSKTPCSVNQCRNQGECTVNLLEVGGFSCKCRAGYYGAICDIVTPDCESNPCKHNSLCVVIETGFRCDCKPEHSGTTCELDGSGEVIPEKGSQSYFTITVVSVVMVVMVILGLFLLLVEHQRERLKRFNEEYKGKIRFKTDMVSVLRVMCSELREYILGHSAKSVGERRKARMATRLKELKRHERNRPKKKGDEEEENEGEDFELDEDYYGADYEQHEDYRHYEEENKEKSKAKAMKKDQTKDMKKDQTQDMKKDQTKDMKKDQTKDTKKDQTQDIKKV